LRWGCSVSRHYKNAYRYSVLDPSAIEEWLEPTEKTFWISKCHRAQKFTFRGVPSRHLDILVEVGMEVLARPVVVEVGINTSKFSPHTQWRLVFRVPVHPIRHSPAVDLVLGVREDLLTIDLGAWRAAFARLRSDLDHYNLARVMMWHYARYYTHLDRAEVFQYADEWGALPHEFATLAEANRAASRELYQLSRDAGWRKLTLREQKKWGLDSQWVRQEVIAERSRDLSATGVSEATLDAASGEDVRARW
jgi:hypothetical protein